MNICPVKQRIEMEEQESVKNEELEVITDKILSIDIGGSHIKATLLGDTGQLIGAYQKIDTPVPAKPETVLAAIQKLVKNFESWSHISTGFPGFVKNGIVKTAPNLGSAFWKDYDLAAALTKMLGKPAKVVNDADMLGLGVVSGKGLEMVITLGTGFGTALTLDGVLLPHFELAHLPVTKHKSYDQYIGEKELKRIGTKRWNERMEKVLQTLKTVFNYDILYIGGGNSSLIRFQLEENMKVVTNLDGIHGGSRLWKPIFQPAQRSRDGAVQITDKAGKPVPATRPSRTKSR